MIPGKLKPGDEVRVVSPSLSLSIISKECRDIAVGRLESMGLKVTFGAHAEETDEFGSSSIQSRVGDLHDAFRDPNVRAVLATIGGWNANQLLNHIDFGLIKANSKVFCGFSDITALSNAIFAKTGLVTYSGPHFSSFGMSKGFDYTLEQFKRCVLRPGRFRIAPSEQWSDDRWYKDQETRDFVKNDGYLVINEGSAKGRLLGGNLCTFNLLHGTQFMPKLKNSILLVEDDDASSAALFDRDLQSLIHQKGFDGVKGIIIGRFQKASNVSDDTLIKIIKSKKELDGLPVIANVNCSHTTPIATFPIGGTAKMEANAGNAAIEIMKH